MALHVDCVNYARIKKLVHPFTKERWGRLECQLRASDYSSLADHQVTLLNELLAPVVGEVDPYEEIEIDHRYEGQVEMD